MSPHLLLDFHVCFLSALMLHNWGIHDGCVNERLFFPNQYRTHQADAIGLVFVQPEWVSRDPDSAHYFRNDGCLLVG